MHSGTNLQERFSVRAWGLCGRGARKGGQNKGVTRGVCGMFEWRGVGDINGHGLITNTLLVLVLNQGVWVASSPHQLMKYPTTAAAAVAVCQAC